MKKDNRRGKKVELYKIKKYFQKLDYNSFL